MMYIPFEVPREASRSNTTSTVLGAPRKLVAAESSADKKKRQALISTVIEHGDRGRIDPQIASTMCTIVEALPASALDPDIVISEDGTIEFDWESETGGGAFTIGVIPTGKVIYDWVWGPDQTSGRTELEGGELHGFIKCCLNELGQKLSHGV
ncbi:MAG: hypothetical protein F4010_05145 [Cenarchaeum sp. SB0669_bin_11]|nr:hypothetical protein [Cenarchaeum sp. SB0669_bin_11]